MQRQAYLNIGILHALHIIVVTARGCRRRRRRRGHGHRGPQQQGAKQGTADERQGSQSTPTVGTPHLDF